MNLEMMFVANDPIKLSSGVENGSESEIHEARFYTLSTRIKWKLHLVIINGYGRHDRHDTSRQPGKPE